MKKRMAKYYDIKIPRYYSDDTKEGADSAIALLADKYDFMYDSSYDSVDKTTDYILWFKGTALDEKHFEKDLDNIKVYWRKFLALKSGKLKLHNIYLPEEKNE